MLAGTPVTRMTDESGGLAQLPGAMAYNAAASLLPVDLFMHLWQGPRDALTLYRDATTLYFSLLPGAVTLSLAAFLVVTALRKPNGPRDEAFARGRRVLWVFAAVGGLGALALHPWRCPHGVAHAAAFPSVVALLVLAWGALGRANPRTALLVCGGMAVEFLAVYWSHVALAGGRGLDDPVSNWALKETNGLVFLADTLGPWPWACAAGVALVQLALVTIAVREAVAVPGRAAADPAPVPFDAVRVGGLSSPPAALL
jgi:hypothetical protein